MPKQKKWPVMSVQEMAREIVAGLLRDLADRSGLRQVWESLDESTKAEICREWENTVIDYLDAAEG